MPPNKDPAAPACARDPDHLEDIETSQDDGPFTYLQIKHLVDRFLSWGLPQDFSVDAFIRIKAEHPTDYAPSAGNLFSAAQAEAMVRNMLQELYEPSPPAHLVAIMGLDWKADRNGHFKALAPFGEVYTAYPDGAWRVTIDGKASKLIVAGEGADAAKAGAEADYVERRHAELGASPQMLFIGWRDISTAPKKNKQKVDLWLEPHAGTERGNAHRCTDAYYHRGDWWFPEKRGLYASSLIRTHWPILYARWT